MVHWCWRWGEMSRDPSFRLEKTYLDVVGPHGDVCIVYGMTLRWGPARVSASSIFVAPVGAPPESHTRLGRTGIMPTHDAMTVTAHACDASGLWRVPAQPVHEETLHRGERGTAVWRCITPSTPAQMRVGGTHIVGTGYAEHLTLSIPPWHLPVRHLLWGRFISAQHSVVWVAWNAALNGHASTQTLVRVLVDGVPVAPVTVTPEGATWAGGTLHLHGNRVLRDGPLGVGPAALVAPLLPRLPRAFLASHETKWLAHGTLRFHSAGGEASETGMAIHEAVLFAPGDP